MLLNFKEVDKILEFLPKDITKNIFDYYNTSCGDCGDELKCCKSCNLYFHIYHSCFNHKSLNCKFCQSSSCPYNSLKNKFCLCYDKDLCETCYYNDKELLKSLTEYVGEVDFRPFERDHTDYYEELWIKGWSELQENL